MLGRLRMDADECIQEFKGISKKLFSGSRVFSRRWLDRKKYDTSLFEAECKRVIQSYPTWNDHTLPGDDSFFCPRGVCQTIVIVTRRSSKSQDVDSSYAFRTYQDSAVPKLAEYQGERSERTENIGEKPFKGLRIWHVARAATAGPTYFKAMNIQGKDYIDGGFMLNNPTVEIYGEVLAVNERVETVVSIGTGTLRQSKAEFFKFGPLNFISRLRTVKKLMGLSMDSESGHDAMRSLAKSNDTGYYRLNIPLDSKEWRLDSWRKRRERVFKHLEMVVDKHLGRPEVVEELQECASVLIERRRSRALNTLQ
ncbi:acyl transferase/acyl hydrolase/lysophospholipase [Clohesyomyces aquaticus]|uniref:Acyl transferase/acyl hydrolase/lysophospholipase n=1 Tax=Clohesyomyces aquaticus TaxID=1231657 RepID=A0A1Y1Y6E1_9PLEO|nr:acyl transferase/acyl hydrolase/lysophospholipase [Clohesyomyces aquaticus]